jgi:hypothetical protein
MKINKHTVFWVFAIIYVIAFLLKFTLVKNQYLDIRGYVLIIKFISMLGMIVLGVLWRKL